MYEQIVSIVTATATDINTEITAKALDGWSLFQLVDKPDTTSTYLIFTRPLPPL